MEFDRENGGKVIGTIYFFLSNVIYFNSFIIVIIYYIPITYKYSSFFSTADTRLSYVYVGWSRHASQLHV